MNYWKKVEWGFRKSNVVKLHYMNFNYISGLAKIYSSIPAEYACTVKLGDKELFGHPKIVHLCQLFTNANCSLSLQ